MAAVTRMAHQIFVEILARVDRELPDEPGHLVRLRRFAEQIIIARNEEGQAPGGRQRLPEAGPGEALHPRRWRPQCPQRGTEHDSDRQHGGEAEQDRPGEARRSGARRRRFERQRIGHGCDVEMRPFDDDPIFAARDDQPVAAGAGVNFVEFLAQPVDMDAHRRILRHVELRILAEHLLRHLHFLGRAAGKALLEQEFEQAVDNVRSADAAAGAQLIGERDNPWLLIVRAVVHCPACNRL